MGFPVVRFAIISGVLTTWILPLHPAPQQEGNTDDTRQLINESSKWHGQHRWGKGLAASRLPPPQQWHLWVLAVCVFFGGACADETYKAMPRCNLHPHPCVTLESIYLHVGTGSIYMPPQSRTPCIGCARIPAAPCPLLTLSVVWSTAPCSPLTPGPTRP